MQQSSHRPLAVALFLFSFGLVLFELVLTRLFGVVLFAAFAHLALGLALLGISLGSVLQHMFPRLVPDEGLERRLGWLALAQGLTTLLAVVCTLSFPLTTQFAEHPDGFGERSSITWDLLDPFWFSLLLPVLTVPFVIAGLGFSGTFQRRKEHIGRLYGADLVGGALGAVIFLPLLETMSGPDTAFVIVLSAGLAALVLFRAARAKAQAGLAGLAVLTAVILLVVSASGGELMKVRYAAGYSEDQVTYTRWTALTRLSIHEDHRGAYVLLDNTSASHVILSQQERAKKAQELNRALVYQLHEPGAHIAILAASAGPEVAVAQHFGHTGIDAIDIAAIGDLVADLYPDNPFNPYTVGDTRVLESDGRAAILHAEEPYDIIQMVHANLHSSAGLMANAWSPSLLETKEAFLTYLEHLSPDGTLSFGRGHSTRALLRSADAALRELGVEDPAQHILYITGNATVMLVKRRPWTGEERDRVADIVQALPTQRIALDPVFRDRGQYEKLARSASLMTDNRPYMDSPRKVRSTFGRALGSVLQGAQDEVEPAEVIYFALAIQVLFVLFMGCLLLALPALRREPTGLKGMPGVWAGLLYVACLGYGYLAVEVVLIHDLVLFVGHPTYAITVVVLALLLMSGLGSGLIQRWAPEVLTRRLRIVLVVVLGLVALQAWVIPPLLHSTALGLPIAARLAITFVCLAPLGFFMGMPFPLAMRILPAKASGIVPWAWALNGLMSVVASLGTVLISRLLGYSQALAVALAFYAVALLLAGELRKVGGEG
jgi:hypothetical protein